jgi:3-hydroxyacyl-CoA dehydrogenase
MSMIVDNPNDPKNGLIQQIHIAYKGNTSYPAWSSAKSVEYLTVANRLLDTWARDRDILWNSLWQEINVATISDITTLTYVLPLGVFALSDFVNIWLDPVTHPNAGYDKFQVIKPVRRNVTGSIAGTAGAVYTTGHTDGRSGQLSLVFNQPLDSRYLGGTIKAGVYEMPAQLAAPTDEVLVDSPVWLIMATASELARNDPSKQDQAALLSVQADNEYKKMITGDQGNSFSQPNNPYSSIQQNTNVPSPVYGAG